MSQFHRIASRFARFRQAVADLPRPLRLGLYGATSGGLLFICLAPTQTLPGAGLFWDKWEHLVAWFLLTTIGFALAPRRVRTITAFALLLGAFIEALQATMGFGRQGDWRDLLADSLGVAAAVILLLVRRRRRG